MAAYPDGLTVREARARYFAANGFGEGGYDARWVKLQAGPLPLYFPNTAARVAAVRFHDLHHVVTGYDTTWTGEAEIGAWEVASGCARHYVAWLLNLQAMAIGLVMHPQAVFRAFVRGRHSANLYREEFHEALLAPTVGEVRHRLQLDRPPPPPTWGERVGFAGWALLSVLTLLATAAVFVAPVGLLLLLFF
jgi:hypothetical protein